ncbi:MAG: class I SAM-dependent methyltransferase [Chitinophagaceae bacterium]|nr:class I SAM-dependent methyltransferase [Chitinophagaceae bacterium]
MQTKEVQGKLWSTAPADWAKHLEPTFIPMYTAVLNRLDLNEEKMVLDAGCGSGLFLSMVVHTGAAIHGVDAAPGLLAVSKKRLPGVTLLIEDLEAIPFSNETFDVVTGFNSFQYAGSFENALAEARRVTKKNGKLVVGIWGKEEDCDAGVILKAVGSLLPPPPPGTSGPFALSEDGKVEAICKSVGLNVIEKQTVFCPWQFAGVQDLLDAFMCTGPCVKAAQIVGEQKVKLTIAEKAESFRLAGDIYYMRNFFTFFIAEKI